MATAVLNVPVLSDGVVLLRPFCEQDARALAAIWRDPDIRTHNEVPEPSEEAALRWVALSAARAAAAEAWEWAIVDAATGALAGRIALKDIDWAHRHALAAYWVAARARGNRFAARSLRLAAAHAFENGLLRIQAECEVDNEPSLRCLVAAGMRHEGTLRAHFISASGAAVDAHVFGLLPEDLAATPPNRVEQSGVTPVTEGSRDLLSPSQGVSATPVGGPLRAESTTATGRGPSASESEQPPTASPKSAPSRKPQSGLGDAECRTSTPPSSGRGRLLRLRRDA